MAALLLKEAARFPAESFEAGQFRHGPLELAGPGLAVAILATEPATRALDQQLATDLAGTGAAVLLIGDVVICAAEHPKTRLRLEHRGLVTHSVPAGELAKAEGGVTCCSVMVPIAI